MLDVSRIITGKLRIGLVPRADVGDTDGDGCHPPGRRGKRD